LFARPSYLRKRGFQMDPYSTLGVAVTATQDEIKKAYRALVRQWHPDYNKSPEASVKFDAIQQAHDLLTRSNGFQPSIFPRYSAPSTPAWQRPTPPYSPAPSERMSKVVQASARKKSDTTQAFAEHEAAAKRNLADFKESQKRIREAMEEQRRTAVTLIVQAREKAKQHLNDARGNHHRVVAISGERDQLIQTIIKNRDEAIAKLADDTLRLLETYAKQTSDEMARFSNKLDAISLQFLKDSGVTR
jgi:hypothetical protein